jgi:hypothetical protein
MSKTAPIPAKNKTIAVIIAILCFFGSINSFMFAFKDDVKWLFALGAFFLYWTVRMIRVYQRPAAAE